MIAMSFDDDLFGDLDVPGIVIEKPYSDDNKKADEAWGHWCKMTGRPQQRTPDRDFIKGYKKLLAEGVQHGRMLTVISGAARMPVRPRDPKDLRRVTYALQSAKGMNEAIALLSEKGREIIPFPDGSEPVFKSTISDLEEACRVNLNDWTGSDHDAASVLIGQYTKEELNELADATARTQSVSGVLPSDLLRNSAALKGKASSKKQEVYDAGRAEEETYQGIVFAADNLADRMRRKGASAAAIRKEHDKAPEGYWDAVLDILIDEPTRTFASVYGQLEKKFAWNPNSRVENEG